MLIRNILITTFRNYIRQPVFSIINIVGLAMGIASSLLIFLFVIHETSYDKFYPDAERIFRINQSNVWSPEGGMMSQTSIPLAQTVLNEYPEIKSAVRITTPVELLVKGGEKSFYEEKILAADSNFFSFFGIKLVEGNPATALAGKNKVVLTAREAEKFFGEESPLGKILLFGEEKTALEVTGVVDQLPSNMHFHFNYLMSISSKPVIEEFSWSWFMAPLVTYVRLNEEASAAHLEEKFKALGPKFIPATMDRFNMNYDDFVADKGGWDFYLQPISEIHLHSAGVGNALGPVGNYTYVYIFTIIGFFILALGCINFINLSTARASKRAREVGIRKVLGSQKHQLIYQHLAESVILCMLATVAGYALMELLKVLLSAGFGLHLYFRLVDIWPFLIFLPIVLGCAAGIYPAFYLTAFSPSAVLKGNLKSGIKSAGFRNTLVVIQFTVAIALVAGTYVINQQLDFLKTKNLGYDKERVIVINHAEFLGEKLPSFREQLATFESIESVSISMDIPGRRNYQDMFTKYGNDDQLSLSMLKIDPFFINTIKLPIAAGRNFEAGQPGDYNTAILNEAAVSSFGWDKETAIGKYINYTGDEVGKLKIIGVVKNFNFESLKEPVRPFVFLHYKSSMWGENSVVTIRYKSGRLKPTLATLRNEWNTFSDTPLSYSFLDAEFDKAYHSEDKLSNLFTLFTILTLIIACIGLFGLSTYMIEQREKEISIRKIFGAGLKNIFILFSKEYLLLIMVAFAIAVPVSFTAASFWLETYAYHIEHSVLPYLFTAIITGLAVVFTTGFKILKAAFKNPVENLKLD